VQIERVVLGGFPAVHRLDSGRLRSACFGDYARTLVERELNDTRRVRQIAEMPDLVRLVASWTAQALNVATLARAAGIAEATAREYLSLFEVIYVHHLLPNWAPSFVAKVKRTPKLHAVDTGSACDAFGTGVDALARPGAEAAGPLLETFVVNELKKQQGWNSTRVDLRHFRDREGREIDVVLQARDGRTVAVEVKAARDVDEHDIRWLAWLRDRMGDRFVRGVVLHLGERPVRFGDRIVALPVPALWQVTG
jgi:predicted AAA+ superfamily ATPase